MIKFDNIKVYGWEAAIRGMRNPKDSWDQIDSTFYPEFKFGPKDLDLAIKLHKAGASHRKYKRYIIVTMDITAPLYWWKEFETYKVGTVSNSCSTMHKIASYEFTRDSFSHEHLNEKSLEVLDNTIKYLNEERVLYNTYVSIKKQNPNTIDDEVLKLVWWQMIQLLPSSFNQTRTVQFSYENATAMESQRYYHKLDEWRILCREGLDKLPYADDIIKPIRHE